MQTTLTSLIFVALTGAVTLAVEPVDREATIKELSQAGYADIEIIGWAPLMCDEWSIHATEYTAKNETGERINGVRCVGKSGVIRHNRVQDGLDD